MHEMGLALEIVEIVKSSIPDDMENARVERVSPGVVHTSDGHSHDGLSSDVSEENVRLVQEALQQIAEEFRQPLVMKEMDGFSYEEIASVLDIPVGTVRSRIFRARKELTERLERRFRED